MYMYIYIYIHTYIYVYVYAYSFFESVVSLAGIDAGKSSQESLRLVWSQLYNHLNFTESDP